MRLPTRPVCLTAAAAIPRALNGRRHLLLTSLAFILGSTAVTPVQADGTFSASVKTQLFGTIGDSATNFDHVNQTVTTTSSPGHPSALGSSDWSSNGPVNSAGTLHAEGNAAGGHVGVAVNGESRASAFLASGSLSASATATVNDVLIIPVSAEFSFGRHIHLVNMLTLDGADEEALHIDGGNTNGHFPDYITGSTNAGVLVSGTGIDPGPRNVNVSGSTFDSFDFVSGEVTLVTNPPSTIKLALDLVVGIPMLTTLSISAGGSANIFDSANVTGKDGFARFKAEFSHTLAWGNTTSFTDPDTGVTLTGVDITSASGFDYAHPGSVVAPGVPEPATWAMLVSGFGAVGAAARRRERRQQSVAA